jgi:cell division septation protein DedD
VKQARLAAFLVLTTPLTAGVASAQSDPRLVAAVRSAQEGSSDSGRAAVNRLLLATAPTDSLYPEIIYTQAMVASEAGEMRRHLQRVVVEYSSSSWADDALLRLVQMDYASRSLDGAAQSLERLRSDYPQTPLVPQAAYWAGRVYFDLKNPALACRWLADGMAKAQDVEVQNQLGYLYQRCGTAEQTDSAAPSTPTSTPGRDSASARPDSQPARPDSQPPRPTAPPSPLPAQRASFRIQVSAVATPGGADDAADKAEKLGYPAVIVRERNLYKVRAGAFATREEAAGALPKLKAAFGGSPFIVAEK